MISLFFLVCKAKWFSKHQASSFTISSQDLKKWGPKSHSLWPVGKKVFNPGTVERGESESDQFGDEDYFIIKGRAIVHKVYSDISLLLILVVQSGWLWR